MKNKSTINLCRNVNILEQVGSPGKRYLGGPVGRDATQIAALFAKDRQNSKIEDLFKQHTNNAYEAGIDKHGHWDLTKTDADAIVNPHFDDYFRKVQSYQPTANRDQHFKRFDDEVTRRAAELHGWGQQQATDKYKSLGNRVATAIANMFKGN